MSKVESDRNENSNLHFELKNQIYSMLKGVIEDEKLVPHPYDRDNESTGLIVDFSHQSRKDLNHNTINPKHYTNKCVHSSSNNNTINSNNDNNHFPFKSNLLNISHQNIFYINQLNNLMITENSLNLLKRETINNNIPMSTTPLGMSMPLRTFNFKVSNKRRNHFPLYIEGQLLYNQDIPQLKNNFKSNIYGNQFAIELELMLMQKNKLTIEIYNRLKGTFKKYITKQETSRILQFYLEQSSTEVIHLIFMEISSQYTQLLLDPYGNYFCLKLFYFLKPEDKSLIIQQVSVLLNNVPFMENLSINKISTYPIQCIIEHISSINEQKLLMNSVSNCLMRLAFDTYGTHVLEKMMANFDYCVIQPISLFILENFQCLSNDSKGLCIVKKMISIEYKRNNFKALQNEVIMNALLLVQDPFGNYVLQTCLELWEEDDIIIIMQQFAHRWEQLSIQKYSSNVIERCLEKSGEFLRKFLNEFTNNNRAVMTLLKNNYGNYVIQTALKVADNKGQWDIVNIIGKNLLYLNNRKMANKWRSIISPYFFFKKDN